jgi:hypothetical protein
MYQRFESICCVHVQDREEDSSETSIPIDQATQPHTPDDCDLNVHRYKNLRSRLKLLFKSKIRIYCLFILWQEIQYRDSNSERKSNI